MQIGCKKFGCQKAVEVCYWTCKFRRQCKDWAGALEGQPGLVAITARLQEAAAKTGRIFDAATMKKPLRTKRRVTATSVAPLVHAPKKPATENPTRPKIASAPQQKITKRVIKPMAKTDETKNIIEIKTDAAATTKTVERKIAPPPVRPKTNGNGAVYLLLSKNGKYKELREAELLKQAANIIGNPAVRLVKGQYLVPHITFKTPDE